MALPTSSFIRSYIVAIYYSHYNFFIHFNIFLILKFAQPRMNQNKHFNSYKCVRLFGIPFTYTQNIWRSFNETASNIVADSALLISFLYIHEHLFLFTSAFSSFSSHSSRQAKRSTSLKCVRQYWRR